MNIKNTLNYFDEDEKLYTFSEKYDNGILLNTQIYFDNDKFIEYQKDLIKDFIIEIKEYLTQEIIDITDIKKQFELSLQNLNTKIKLFSEKVKDIEYFQIKGFVQILYDNLLISSMIGDVSILIFRDNTLYYFLHNSIDNTNKSDLFSDFVEGDVQIQDQIVYIGKNIKSYLDDNDIKDLEGVLEDENTEIVLLLKDVLKTRIDEKSIGFISSIHITNLFTPGKSFLGKNNKKGINNKWKKKLLANKYYITIPILGLIILFLLYHVLTQLINTNNSNIFVNESGEVMDITIEDIKKDIYMFESYDSSSDQKSIKYNEIMQKLELLESRGKWVEDVKILKDKLQEDYYKGFNIIYVTDLEKKFDDPTMNKKTRIITFNSAEQEKLGELKSINWGKNLMIAGNKGSLISTLNSDLRGSLVELNIEENIENCSINLLRDGLYCFTNRGKLHSITKAGVEPLTISDGSTFPNTIKGINVYGKANMYLFQPNLSTLKSGVLVTRYRNVLGTQVQFQPGQNYSLIGTKTGIDLSSGDFAGFTIDSTFLVWYQNQLYQFRRENTSSTYLDVRKIPLVGGDKSINNFSNNVKILANINSRFVHIFDKTNQTLTVYESRPLKTNDAFYTNYNLYYLFKFKFNLEDTKVIDVVIPDETGDRPELYILSDKGVNKVSLYDIIDSIKENTDISDFIQ